ncbi:Pantothenate synthetase [Aquimixticola soesokkakensis]|uniref:Pantothenate synthetase n=1 Tax=Aquimixticola soesokkakensis TaxID=1519096 RepID=A0A1Y5T130_9RHOB|nr:pantoate--beta-alanine ligase [Aquimixticola soesokkakensis]SLN53523.1 Pantothenate synthetase [Aquimixticola soesokkakensis]
MEILRLKSEVRAQVAAWKAAGLRVGLVPTMGFLHEGHLTLVRAALADCDRVVVSIFVNPTQFGEASDLEAYPRDEARDADLLRGEGVDLLFAPEVGEIYAEGAQTTVETEDLAQVLMGALRPGHYKGVCTIVCKLFNITGADAAFFGEKDYQQLRVIRTMVRDLDIPVEVVGVATVRAPDGLALSSRNSRLAPEDRDAALVLNRALALAEYRLADGVDADDLAHEITNFIAAQPRAQVESVDIRDAETLAEVHGDIVAPVVILLAARFGPVLLIDQRVASPD